MKNRRYYRSLCFISALLAMACISAAQDSAKKELLVDVGYYVPASNTPYLLVNTKTKVGKKFQPVPGINVSLYLDNSTNFLGSVIADVTGTAKIVLPASARDSWRSSSTHVVIATTKATIEYDEVTAEASVTKATLMLDTVPEMEVRTVRARIMTFADSERIPVKDVDIKLSVKRLGSYLPVGEEESYTTDSTGEAIAAFKMDKLPGDTAGNIILVAKIEDNEQFGNLATEIKVPWGIAVKANAENTSRTLWATRDKAPVWLLITAASIVIVVWGCIVYLLMQIARIRKLGTAQTDLIQST